MKSRKQFIAFTAAVVLTAVTAIVCFAGVLPTASDAQESVVIKQGSTGSQVKTIQTKLKNWGYYTGSVDGIFGSQTAAAVKYFQRKNGLTADGIVGSKTAAAMGITLSSGSSSNSGYTSSDTNLLARCISAEARGEPYLGQVAVAAVILNRVKHPDFPNSISGVIYQPWAFSSVNDGQINSSPTQSALNAARDALNGWDPTNGCIYFYNPAKTTNSWITSRTVMLVIGDHYFAK